MISGLKNRDILTEKQQRIRNKELIGLSLTKREKKLIEGGVDDEIEVDDLDEDFDEVWGYYDDEEIDIKNLTRTELGELIYKVLTDKDYQ